jgi:hypothetical protein
MGQHKAALRIASGCKRETATRILRMNDGSSDGGRGLIHRYSTDDAVYGSLCGRTRTQDRKRKQEEEQPHAPFHYG